MSIENVKLSKEELDWIQLRKELDEIRGNDAKKSSFSMETWYIPVGMAITTACFCYGFYHMNHPTKSTIGAYCRIFSQGFTGIGAMYVFLKFEKQGKTKKVNMDYTD